ncbi:MAG TPA: sulfite exporter TauE/SafE family protein [Bacteroidetes bacterium]|nr:sulfite exporter TauE/SafE family protein [Bacteroidota bacterium]
MGIVEVIFENILPLLLVGSLTGLLAGFFGVGGGIILGPFLLFFFQSHGMNVDIAVRVAFGTSLFCAVFNSIFSVYRHGRQGNVVWKVVPYIAGGSIFGAFAGSSLAAYLPGIVLKYILAGVLLLLAFQVFAGVGGGSKSQSLKMSLKITLPIGFVSGFFAAMAGIGGGVFFVPVIILFLNVPVKKTAGTSSAIIIFTALAGVSGYILHGLPAENLPHGSLGYVYVLAAIPILAGSLVFSQFGAYLNSILPLKYLRAFFSLFLLAIFIKLVLF